MTGKVISHKSFQNKNRIALFICPFKLQIITMNLRAERELSTNAYGKSYHQKLDNSDVLLKHYENGVSKHYFVVKNIIQVIMNDK